MPAIETNYFQMLASYNYYKEYSEAVKQSNLLFQNSIYFNLNFS